MTDVRRMRGIARIAARRKYHAVDLMEEHLADWEGRQRERELGVPWRRAMHLQTADARMPNWKARNWDLFIIVGAVSSASVAAMVAVVVWATAFSAV